MLKKEQYLSQATEIIYLFVLRLTADFFFNEKTTKKKQNNSQDHLIKRRKIFHKEE